MTLCESSVHGARESLPFEEPGVEKKGTDSTLEGLLQRAGAPAGHRALNVRFAVTALLLGCAAIGALCLHSGVRPSWRGQVVTSTSQASLEATLGRLISLDEQSDAQVRLATCAIDVDEAAFYLAQAGNFIKFATLRCQNRSTLRQRTTCTVAIGTIIASFGWVASYTGASVSDCSVEDNVPASCAAGLSTLVALLGEFVFVSSAVVDACNMTADLPDEEASTPLPRFRFLPHKKRKPVPEPDELRAARISQCVVDVDVGLAYLGFVGVQSYRLSRECPAGDTKACGLDVFNVIASLGLATQFMSDIAVDCPMVSNLAAGCSAVLGDFVASIAALGPVVDQVTSKCPNSLS